MTQERSSRRATRVAERIREELMELLLRGAIRDPHAAGVFVSSVAVSKDLRHARVYIRLTDGGSDEVDRNNAVKALNKAQGHLKRGLAPRLELKNVPDFSFFWDDKVDEVTRIEALLAEIRDESEDG